MNTHTNISTLPIGCYVNIFNSIIDGKPDFRWLLKFNYENEPIPEVTDEEMQQLSELYEEIQYQLPANAVNRSGIENDFQLKKKIIKLWYVQFVDYDRNKEIELINDINFLRMKIEQSQSKEKPKHFDLMEYSLAIEMSLNIRVSQFDRSVKEFFRLLELVEIKNKKQKQ